MSAFSRLLVASVGFGTLMLSTAATAAPVAAKTDATGSASILRPLTMLKQADLDFGELVVAGSGTAVVDPVSAGLTTTGGLATIGATAHPATFTTTGSKNSVVLIRIPTAAVTLTQVGGSATMTVSNWTLDGSTNRRIPQNSAFNFSVGGTLNVAAGQADGTYTGTFTITVQYP
ncbi:MAG TPA: DUF4402 domain-containing protein [Sphingomicrobium sp.]|nr:DUF4402 domain-containing protein [Sphingomicrobium sp.]